MENQKKPVAVVTNPEFSQSPYVVFEGDNHRSLICDEWIDEAVHRASEYGEEITKTEAEESILEEFADTLTDVDEFHGDYLVINDNWYYRYDQETGEAVCVGQYDSIEECRELAE